MCFIFDQFQYIHCMSKKIVIAIDGWSSCGKSTLAKRLAQALDYLYIDSGAMYRAITFYFIREGVHLLSEEEVKTALANITIEFKNNPISGQSEIYLNSENVETSIRNLAVAEKVSDVSALEAVREFAVSLQKQYGEQKGIVMDGRDIGTAVFPFAELKIFMTADIDVRVERRFIEVLASNMKATKEEVKENLVKRDYIDSNRKISPLKKADDAKLLDSTHLSINDLVEKSMAWIKPLIS